MNFEEQLSGFASGRYKHNANWETLDKESITTLADFGVLNVGYSMDRPKSSFLNSEVRRWIENAVGEKSLNSSFLDTTTIYTVNSLINSADEEVVMPETLLDLATFVNAVVLYDHVFHLENPGIDSLSLNEALGNQPIIVSIPVESFDGPLDFYGGVSGPGALLVGMWEEATEYNEVLRKTTKDQVPTEDRQEILKAWETILGRPLEYKELFSEYSSKHWSSWGASLLAKLITETRMRDYHYSGSQVIKNQSSEFIEECNRRSMFNLQLADSLGLPYLPSASRLPFHRFLYRRAQSVQRHLATIKRIEEEYVRRAEQYFSPDDNNLIMPFFLATVLAKISSLSEFFEELAEVRRKAEPLRNCRAEMDAALLNGDVKVAKELRAAFEKDAAALRSKFPYAPVAGGIAAILAAVGGMLPNMVLISIGLLTAGSQMQEDFAKLERRALNRRYWVLSDMKDTANALTSALPQITKLWNLKDVRAEKFSKHFSRLKSLGYA